MGIEPAIILLVSIQLVPKNSPMGVCNIVLAPPLLAVVPVGVQREPAAARALVPAERVAALVLAAPIVVGALIYVDVVRGREARVVD